MGGGTHVSGGTNPDIQAVKICPGVTR